MPRRQSTFSVGSFAALGMIGWMALVGCDMSPPTPKPGAAGSGTPAAAPSGGMAPSGNPNDPVLAGPTPSADQDDSGPFAEGKKVFRAQNCARCHSIGGQMAGGPGPGGHGGPPSGHGLGGPGGPGPGSPGAAGGPPAGPGGPPGGPGGRGFGRGPDLAKVGTDPNHSVEWLMQYIRNPKATKPDSRMPPFEGKISEDDLKALAEYLASLK